jgi:hypothetical protein
MYRVNSRAMRCLWRLIALQLLQSLGIWPLGMFAVSFRKSRCRCFHLHSDYLTLLCCQQLRGVLSFLSVVLLFASPLLLQLLEQRRSQRHSPLDPHSIQNQNLTQSTFLQLPTLQQVVCELGSLMSSPLQLTPLQTRDLIIGPATEELVFRRLLQSWQTKFLFLF